MLLLTGDVGNTVCGVQTSVVDKADTGIAFMGVQNQSDPLVLAHELGHVLGIAQHDASVPNLMNPVASQLSTVITPAHCAIARAKAAQYVQTKWGITVNPTTPWTPVPPFKR